MEATIEDKPRYRWFMLAWLMLMSLILGLVVAIMPPLFNEIKDDLSLTHAQVGIIWGAISFGTLLSAMYGGLLGDRFGFKKIIALGLIISTGACVMRACLFSFWGLTSAMAILGMATGLIYPNISKAVGEWFPRRELGRALGLVNVEAALGWAVALMVGASLSSLMGGWRPVMWLMAAICSGAIIMWAILARERHIATGESRGSRPSILEQARSVLRVRDVWLVATMEVCISGALVSAIGLLPETLAERGTPASTAGNYASLITWTVAAANIIVPYISDRIGLRKSFVWPLLLTSSASATFLGIFFWLSRCSSAAIKAFLLSSMLVML